MAEGGPRRDKPDHERFPQNSCLHSRHSLVQCENASVETCTIMNFLGYGSHIRQARRDAYSDFDRLQNARFGYVQIITTGSKAEGLTRWYENDFDHLFVDRRIICLEDGVNSDRFPMETIVFTLNTEMCYHGHCRLYLQERHSTIIPTYMYDALCNDENGHVLLSSTLYFDSINEGELEEGTVRHERAGPSSPNTVGALHQDYVVPLYCHCPGILLKWAERSRHWPPPEIVHKVVTKGAFVTPVGFKGSEYHHVEWRICFNTGENELVSSLNNIQVYTYVLLKMIVKEVLKPLKKEITSYTVKNIVFWLAENNPQAQFDERSLFYWLREGLGELRTALLNIHLPYYMIPERNLMAACGLNEEQKRIWVETITDMMNEGETILCRLPRIRKAIASHPEPLMWYSKKRVELELLNLYYAILIQCSVQCGEENDVVNRSDPMQQAIECRMIEIYREVSQRMYWEGSRLNDLRKLFIMMLM